MKTHRGGSEIDAGAGRGGEMQRPRALFIMGSQTGAIAFTHGLVHVIDADDRFPVEAFVIDDDLGSTPSTVDVVNGQAAI
jgi:hypothetical protein